MERYESHQVRICRPASMIYDLVSDFSNFTPILRDKVEDWVADSDSCSFRVKGIGMTLRITEREPCTLVKIESEEGSPFAFKLWVQLREIEEADTRMRLVLHVTLGMMMKMMVGRKIQGGLDQIADQIAEAFNSSLPQLVDRPGGAILPGRPRQATLLGHRARRFGLPTGPKASRNYQQQTRINKIAGKSFGREIARATM